MSLINKYWILTLYTMEVKENQIMVIDWMSWKNVGMVYKRKRQKIHTEWKVFRNKKWIKLIQTNSLSNISKLIKDKYSIIHFVRHSLKRNKKQSKNQFTTINPAKFDFWINEINPWPHIFCRIPPVHWKGVTQPRQWSLT